MARWPGEGLKAGLQCLEKQRASVRFQQLVTELSPETLKEGIRRDTLLKEGLEAEEMLKCTAHTNNANSIPVKLIQQASTSSQS